MAENPEFSDVVEQKTQEVIGRLINEQDWDEEDKTRLHKEYMNVRISFFCIDSVVIYLLCSLHLATYLFDLYSASC